MHRKLNVIVIAGMLVALAVVSVASGTSAGPLDPTAGPTNTNAYTLDQLWNRLSAGAAETTPRAFTEPSIGPGTGTMHTLDEIMAVAPAVDDTNGASATDVVSGKKFWGLTTAGWGVKTGTAASGNNVSGANGSLTFAIPNGFYTEKTATAQDAALMAGNIKKDVSIFGVTGNVVQASGTATAAQVLSGVTFCNASVGSTGTMTNNGAWSTTPGTTAQTIPTGYHNGSGAVAGDSDLMAGNIREGANIFGVAGSSIEASGTAVEGEVLLGKTFSKAGAAGLTGSMPNRGAVILTPGPADVAIVAGYHNGSGTVVGDTDLTVGNIKKDVTIFGVTGEYRGWTCTGTMNGTRWCDNLDGTVRDMTTGLIWLKKANWGGRVVFWNTVPEGTNANDLASQMQNGANGAGLTDGSKLGDWRLPTLAELTALMSGTEAVSSDSADWRAFVDVQAYGYWSSTAAGLMSPNAWYIRLDNGLRAAVSKSIVTAYVWPVRNGQ
jgi:hypothetical protein